MEVQKLAILEKKIEAIELKIEDLYKKFGNAEISIAELTLMIKHMTEVLEDIKKEVTKARENNRNVLVSAMMLGIGFIVWYIQKLGGVK